MSFKVFFQESQASEETEVAAHICQYSRIAYFFRQSLPAADIRHHRFLYEKRDTQRKQLFNRGGML
jgi:hypothetical protein